MKLSIVIPCYNEAKNIPLILDKFNQVIRRNDIEVLLVNNGSTDDSAEVMNQLAPGYAFIRIVTVPVNQGYGFGITSGLEEAKGEYIGYTHADMQTDPADVIKALELIEMQPDPMNCYVKGNRKGRPLFDQFFTSAMSLFESLYLKKKLWDINAQPNIFHHSFFKGLKYIPKDFSLDLYFLFMAQKNGLHIIRFEVQFPERLHGHSSWNNGLKSKWKFIKRTLDFSVKLKKEL